MSLVVFKENTDPYYTLFYPPLQEADSEYASEYIAISRKLNS